MMATRERLTRKTGIPPIYEQRYVAEQRLIAATAKLHAAIGAQSAKLHAANEQLRLTVEELSMAAGADNVTTVRSYETVLRSIVGAPTLPAAAADAAVRAVTEKLEEAVVRAVVAADPDVVAGSPLAEFYEAIIAAAEPAVSDRATTWPLVSRKRVSEITGLTVFTLRQIVDQPKQPEHP